MNFDDVLMLLYDCVCECVIHQHADTHCQTVSDPYSNIVSTMYCSCQNIFAVVLDIFNTQIQCEYDCE